MHLNIPEKWNSFIHDQIQAGHYHSASEIIDEALALLKEQAAETEYDPELEALLLEGLNSGPAVPFTAADWDEIERGSKDRIAARKAKNPDVG